MSYLLKQKIENWQVKVLPHDECPAEVRTEADWLALNAEALAASVPGEWILDYVREGIFPDPYFGDNYIDLMNYERHHAFYFTKFDSDTATDDCYLRFEGIDTVADIYLNGEKIGHAENMFIEHEFLSTGIKKGENCLLVHILPVVLEARKHRIDPGAAAFKYNAECLVVRKAAHSFGWDICPRIVTAGLWKEVYLIRKPKKRIVDVCLITHEIEMGKLARCVVSYNVDVGDDDIRRYKLKVMGKCGASIFTFADGLWAQHGQRELWIPLPKLWWVRGYGKANLYSVTATLLCDDKVVDEYVFKTGIRTIQLVRDDVTCAEKPGEFVFLLNGKRIFIKGTNWVPCDAFHSRDAERMPKIFDLVLDCGCNALRVWGGGVYESDAFYDLCDSNGVFVWQDIMMACAIYPQTERMKTQLAEEVLSVARRLVNHPSLCLWAGDNECDVAYAGWFGGGRDPDKNLLTRVVIPEVLSQVDPMRPYLPSSPYITGEAVTQKLKTPEQHLWGPRKYFKGKFYRDNNATFASEIGYHGCNSEESIKKFIPTEYLWGYKGNKMWLYHAASPELKASPYTYRIRLMAKQITYFFGEKPMTLGTFSKMSQIVQAEAKKYFIESFRCREGAKTGLIWWNIMDCWPQFSDAVVDYYYDKKLAYYYIKNSQRPILLMMDKIGKELHLFGVNDTQQDVKVNYAIKVNGRVIAKGEANLPANSAVDIRRIRACGRQFFAIEFSPGGGKVEYNHYLSGRPFFAYKWYIKKIEQSGVLQSKE